MNLKVLQWLLANREALLKIVDIAKGFDRKSPRIDQWNIIDKIARIVIPMLDDSVQPASLVRIDYAGYATESYDVQLMATGAEVQALGIDWKMLVDVILPIVIAILQSLASKKE